QRLTKQQEEQCECGNRPVASRQQWKAQQAWIELVATQQLNQAVLSPELLAQPFAPAGFKAPVEHRGSGQAEQAGPGAAQAQAEVLVLAGAQTLIEAADPLEPVPLQAQVGSGEPVQQGGAITLGGHLVQPGAGVPGRLR